MCVYAKSIRHKKYDRSHISREQFQAIFSSYRTRLCRSHASAKTKEKKRRELFFAIISPLRHDHIKMNQSYAQYAHLMLFDLEPGAETKVETINFGSRVPLEKWMKRNKNTAS